MTDKGGEGVIRDDQPTVFLTPVANLVEPLPVWGVGSNCDPQRRRRHVTRWDSRLRRRVGDSQALAQTILGESESW